MKTIYLVTKGEYDDYCVVAVFSKRKLAEKFARAIEDKWDTPEIEERILDPIDVEEDERFYDVFFDGDLHVTEVNECSLRSLEEHNKVWEHAKGNGFTVSGVLARDKGEATKKATDVLLDCINKEI